MTQAVALATEDYEYFCQFLEQKCGIVLGTNKQYLVTSRLNRLTNEFSLAGLDELMDNLKKGVNRKLQERVVDAMTTNETSWFRDNYPFEMLKNSIYPELAKTVSGPIRIWSAASSTGQESYSISIATTEFQQRNPGLLNNPVEIIGTDISPSVVQIAREAKYDELSLARGLSAERREKFFIDHHDGGLSVRSEIRSRTRFSELNLMGNYSLLGKFDIIFCRNVLIYFSSEMKSDILTRMAQVMKPRGYLFLGGSESPTGYCSAFEMVRLPDGVVYRLKDGWKP
ncbi:MAG: protein-glutamate O-methyltransferase CheR [Thioalkalispiraceae bacterium]|jgi:chemotaxis protein methyltransferase CheR